MATHKINFKLNDLELTIIIKIVTLVLKALKLLKSQKKENLSAQVDLESINKELEEAHGNSDNEPEAETEGIA